MMDDKKRINEIKEKIHIWKNEGYEVKDIEEFVDFIDHYKQMPRQLLTKKRKYIIISIIAILFACILVLITIPIAINYEHSLLSNFGSKNYIRINYGQPFKWLRIGYLGPTDQISMKNIEIMSIRYLIIDFIIYFLIVFCFSLIISNFNLVKDIIFGRKQ